MHWQTSRFSIDLTHPKVMGIVNVTPDSFSDGGHHNTAKQALAHCERLLADGADVLDLGAESTRPGAPPVDVGEEWFRLQPVLSELVRWNVPISIDTYKPTVMQAALDLGADIINDIWALRQPGHQGGPSALDVVLSHPSCGVCLMHMHKEPQTMQSVPMTGDVLPQVTSFLREAAAHLVNKGVGADRVLLDPGIGFGKTPEQNFALLARQRELLELGFGVLAGWSRKSALGHAIGDGGAKAAQEGLAQRRLVPSAVAAVLAVQEGACVVRVHDVRETCQALAVLKAVNSARQCVAR